MKRLNILKSLRSFLRDRTGSSLISLALTLPVMLLTLLASLDVYLYYRANAAVEESVMAGVSVATSREVLSIKNDSEFLDWTDSEVYVTPISQTNDQCQGWNASSAQAGCFGANGVWNSLVQDPSNPLLAYVWNGYDSSTAGNSIPQANVRQLPFELYKVSNNGAPLVQALPVVCIPESCREPYHEDKSQLNGNCQTDYIKPLCWQNDIKADFDGDGKEDLVFFYPNGDDVDEISAGEDPYDHADWIVYHSGSGFSPFTGMSFFNLGGTSATSPARPGGFNNRADIPIVADWDQDGIADYAIYSPDDKKYKIAFSSRHYLVVGEGEVKLSYNAGTTSVSRGDVAIPGKYFPVGSKQPMQFALFKTATGGDALISNEANKRYSPVIITPTWSDTALASASPGTLDFQIEDPAPVVLSHARFKPPVGYSAVPAFADYNRDGQTEIGWLSYQNGNLSRKRWGATAAQPSNPPSQDEVFFDVSGGTLPADGNGLRMNPFDIDVDSDGTVYYTDAIDGRVWMLTSKNSYYEPSLLMNSVTARRNHTSEPQYSSYAEMFPQNNIWSVPPYVEQISDIQSGSLSDLGASALNTVLTNPYGIVVGPDNAVYVADYGGKRILRIYNLSNTVSGSSIVTEVVGSHSCVIGGCTAINSALSSGTIVETGSVFSNLDIAPMALEIVPQPASSVCPGCPTRYDLAFSSGNQVYIVKTDPSRAVSNPLGYGPGGISTNGESILHLAGLGTAPADSSTLPSTLTNPVSARGTEICPISSLSFDKKSFDSGTGVASLVAASSCSLLGTNGAYHAGGILRISAYSGSSYQDEFTGSGASLAPRLSLVAGGFYNAPYIAANSGIAAENGRIKRKVQLNHSSPEEVDIINPVSVLVNPNGDILFVNQWAMGIFNIGIDTFDRLYEQNIYRAIVGADPITDDIVQIEVLTNPQQYGYETFPVKNAHWYAPNTEKISPLSLDSDYKIAHEAPLKNIPFPAGGGIAFNEDMSQIYSARPYIAGDLSDREAFLSDNPSTVGFIYGINLDQDGDGIPDFDSPSTVSWYNTTGFNDSDLDGDRLANSAEGPASSSSARSPYCPEINGAAENTSCRIEEKIGSPKWHFVSADPGSTAVSIPDPSGSSNNFDFVEFYFVNSSTENTVAASGGVPVSSSRPEVWATLLNRGDFTGAQYADTTSSTGPIAMPQPLHAFVGIEASAIPALPKSYPDLDGNSATNQFLFPVIMSSVSPTELGVKPVQRVPSLAAVANSNVEHKSSGVLCWDYKDAEQTTAESSPFALNLNNELDNFVLSNQIDAFNVDNLHYFKSCAGSIPALTIDGVTLSAVGSEGVVLRFDHDDYKKDSYVGGAANWPTPWFTGRVNATTPEDLRLYYFVDHDGDGVREPTTLAREVWVDSTSVLANGVNIGALVSGSDRKSDRPYTVATGKLSHKQNIYKNTDHRYPFSDPQLYGGSGYVNSAKFLESYNLNSPNWSAVWHPIYFGFQKEASSTTQYATTLYDRGTPLFDTIDKNYDGFVASLDFMPFFNSLTSAASTANKESSERLGRENKFEDIAGDGLSFALVTEAAKRSLENTLNVEVLSNPDATPAVNQATIKLLPNNCEQESVCTSLKVTLNYHALGYPRTIALEQPLGKKIENYRLLDARSRGAL